MPTSPPGFARSTSEVLAVYPLLQTQNPNRMADPAYPIHPVQPARRGPLHSPLAFLVLLLALFSPALVLGAPVAQPTPTTVVHGGGSIFPLLVFSIPFALILLAIAVLPLIPAAAHWWEHNRNKLFVSATLALVVCAYYLLRGTSFHEAAPGLASLALVLKHSVLTDYVPFMVLLFSLFTISGGIRLTGDIPAHPSTNTLFLLIGALLASFIGTTGASMVLIRPLLQINSERQHVKHTVIFFIFLVSNIGGALLPVGDPPLFLGYLRGVPFLWTLRLTPMWLTSVAILLVVYWIFDTLAYRHEDHASLQLDETTRIPLTLHGKFNFLLLAGVVLAVALLIPGRQMLLGWKVPDLYLREIAMLGLAFLSFWITPAHIHKENYFNFTAIAEVACLFIGIFITMQVPIELLNLKGPELGLATPAHFFWVSGALSSFLDNAPTYVVFFEAASTLPCSNPALLLPVLTQSGHIAVPLLAAVSLGSVFMGANTYIGNGPNFLVKSIAEHRGVRMPSFFGYMAYSGLILIPLFIVITLIFF